MVARDRSWQLDLMALEGATIEQDLGRRDLTVNAIAEPLGGGDHVDPFGGIEDLRARILRAVSGAAFLDDPLRVMRLARLACELNFEIELGTAEAARAVAPRLTAVSPERVFEELKRLICADRAPDGIGLLGSLGIAAAVLPELDALDGVDQSRFHHLDVLGHTRLVLAETIRIVDDPAVLCERDDQASALRQLLEAPFANGLTRGQALRFGALLHDIAKPQTRDVTDEGRVTFMGHDRAGAELARVDPAAAAGVGEALRARRGADAAPPAARVSRAPGAAVATRRLRLPADLLADRCRRDAAERRRPARHPRRQLRTRDRQARRAGADDADRGAGLGGEPAASAGPWRRAGPGARDRARARASAGCWPSCRRRRSAARSARPSRRSTGRGSWSRRTAADQ